MVSGIKMIFNYNKNYQETMKHLPTIPWKKFSLWCVSCYTLGIIGMVLVNPNPLLAQNPENSSMVLSKTQIQEKIQTLPGWSINGQEITRTFQFSDFVAAIAFVNQLVEPAEAAGHHPDIAISYNKVTISLTTHDAGGITNQDFSLAETISRLAK